MDFSGQYLTYTEYRNLGGTLAETPFNILEFEARKIVDYNTFGRLKNLKTQENEVKMCILNLIEEENKEENSIGKSSESVGNYSVTYKDLSIDEKNHKYVNIVKMYLSDLKLSDGTPYLYCGADK